ncbi:metal-sensing transcriptional repressor [Paraburkholderia fungorum]|uniref:Uncharacterized protein n=1 Tax=Paraburkholderia fungorum TaxID=134537 RepID=A0A420FS77_9BURK|nr:metal-sensing transcriptional repressor [Paraburkholderia fungorum]RKF35761.1 hypothetical protein BCY88_08975 [Paraburkholderia fungorum]
MIAMIEAGRNSVNIVQQLHAIEKAITNAKKALVHDHVAHGLKLQSTSDAASAQAVVTEFKKSARTSGWSKLCANTLQSISAYLG